MKGYVALEDGTVYEGESFGATGECVGEVVFNTSMCGYQEILTDPSYSSQIVTMTYPLIGNYGVNANDIESKAVQVSGFIVKEHCPYPSNFTSEGTLSDYLSKNKIIGIAGIDTRSLTKRIRTVGALKGVISAGDGIKHDDLVDKAKAWQGLVGLDLAKHVTCKEPYEWDDVDSSDLPKCEKRFRVVAFDFGIKHNILRILRRFGCQVRVVPASTSADEVLACNPDGIFLSNGPGDPAAVTYAIDTIRTLLGKRPTFGICLGHQLLGLALGGKTFKLKFGHRGANHPVRQMHTGVIEITSQNHGFSVDFESVKDKGAELTHLNLNDKTCEGFSAKKHHAFSVQYHPEASPGPHDSSYLFGEFIRMMS
jgi:carbamoyl-phosphate synthase small subunit